MTTNDKVTCIFTHLADLWNYQNTISYQLDFCKLEITQLIWVDGFFRETYNSQQKWHYIILKQWLNGFYCDFMNYNVEELQGESTWEPLYHFKQLDYFFLGKNVTSGYLKMIKHCLAPLLNFRHFFWHRLDHFIHLVYCSHFFSNLTFHLLDWTSPAFISKVVLLLRELAF